MGGFFAFISAEDFRNSIPEYLSFEVLGDALRRIWWLTDNGKANNIHGMFLNLLICSKLSQIQTIVLNNSCCSKHLNR
jgi:hypothetical protein